MLEASSFHLTFWHVGYKRNWVPTWYTSTVAPGTRGGCGMVGNRGAVARRPPEWQQALLEAKPGAYEALKKGAREADAKNLPLFRQQGLIEVRYTDEQLDRFREVAGRPVWDAWVEDATTKGLPGKELLD